MSKLTHVTNCRNRIQCVCLSFFKQTNKQTHIGDPTSNRIHGRQNSTNFLSIINVGCVMMNFFWSFFWKKWLPDEHEHSESVKILINNIVSGSLVVVVVIVCCMPLLLLLLLNNHCQTNHSSVNYFYSNFQISAHTLMMFRMPKKKKKKHHQQEKSKNIFIFVHFHCYCPILHSTFVSHFNYHLNIKFFPVSSVSFCSKKSMAFSFWYRL